MARKKKKGKKRGGQPAAAGAEASFSGDPPEAVGEGDGPSEEPGEATLGSEEPAGKPAARAPVDPNTPSADGRVSPNGGLYFVAVIFGLIAVAIAVQFAVGR